MVYCVPIDREIVFSLQRCYRGEKGEHDSPKSFLDHIDFR